MKGKFSTKHLIVHLILLAGVAVVVFPFLWMMSEWTPPCASAAVSPPPTDFYIL